MTNTFSRLVELALVLTAVTIPQFVLANRIDKDEFEKAAASLGAAGITMGAYRFWRNGKDTEEK